MQRSHAKRSLLLQSVIICENCGKKRPLLRSRAQKRRFCSNQCASIARRKHTSLPLVQIGSQAFVCLSCQMCHKNYYKRPAFAQTSRYCSRKCQSEGHRKFKTYARCPTCDESFLITKDNRKFCSIECLKTARPMKICEACGQQFRPYHTKQTGRFCSQRCKNKIQIGTGNPNYKGAEKVRYGYDWTTIRNIALERDGHRCQVCFKDYGKIHVHHVTPYRMCRSHTLENLIALCMACHKKYEFGLKHRERPQTREDFLFLAYADRQQLSV